MVKHSEGKRSCKLARLLGQKQSMILHSLEFRLCVFIYSLHICYLYFSPWSSIQKGSGLVN